MSVHKITIDEQIIPKDVSIFRSRMSKDEFDFKMD